LPKAPASPKLGGKAWAAEHQDAPCSRNPCGGLAGRAARALRAAQPCEGKASFESLERRWLERWKAVVPYGRQTTRARAIRGRQGQTSRSTRQMTGSSCATSLRQDKTEFVGRRAAFASCGLSTASQGARDSARRRSRETAQVEHVPADARSANSPSNVDHCCGLFARSGKPPRRPETGASPEHSRPARVRCCSSGTHSRLSTRPPSPQGSSGS